MTGFEYCAAVGMIYEGMTDEALTCIRSIRDRLMVPSVIRSVSRNADIIMPVQWLVGRV